MKSPILEIISLYKSYNKIKVLKGINLKVFEGERISLIGQSGCGKTTLLNLIAGFDEIDAGDIKIFNQSIKNKSENEKATLLKNHIGYIFQSYHLLNELTVLENICLPYLNINYNWTEAKKRARNLLDRVELINRENHYPIELSGGEKQRTAICRALINNPSLILADEPTGNLDEENMLRVKNLIERIHKEDRKTIILVTHHPTMAENSTRKLNLVYGKLESEN